MATVKDTTITGLLEQLVADGPDSMAEIFTSLFNLAMRLERERFLSAGHYERAAERRGYANGTKPKLIDTLAGTLSLDVPKTVGAEEPFYPQALLGTWPTFVPRRHAGGRRDVREASRPAMPSGSWLNSA